MAYSIVYKALYVSIHKMMVLIDETDTLLNKRLK